MPESKKLRVYLLSLAVIVAQYIALVVGVQVSPEMWATIGAFLGTNGVYLLAQGRADQGKEAAKVAKEGFGTSPGVK